MSQKVEEKDQNQGLQSRKKTFDSWGRTSPFGYIIALLMRRLKEPCWKYVEMVDNFFSRPEMKMPCPNAQGWLRAKFIWWQHNSSVTRSKFDRHKLAVKYYQIIQISPLTTWLSTRLIYVGALCFISNQFNKFKERILLNIFSRSIIVFFRLREVAMVQVAGHPIDLESRVLTRECQRILWYS